MKLINSFKYAIAGFLHCVKHERNFRIHLIAAGAVIGFSVMFIIPTKIIPIHEFVLIIFAAALVLICEMINTAIERTVDALKECSKDCDSDKLDGLRKAAKDVAAGAVLVSAIFAAIVGIAIFLPALVYTVRLYFNL